MFIGLHLELVLIQPTFRFFNQTKYTSFQRQLNIYGFSRFAQGKDKGAYFHLCFVRGHRSLVRNMIRRKIKNNKSQAKTEIEDHDFYHPAWENHFEASVPQEIRFPAPGKSSPLTQMPSRTIASTSLLGCTFVLPSSVSAPVPFQLPTISSAQTVQPTTASMVSDDSSWDFSTPTDDLDVDGNLAYFDGTPFQLLNDNLPPFVQTHTVGASFCTCNCEKNNATFAIEEFQKLFM